MSRNWWSRGLLSALFLLGAAHLPAQISDDPITLSTEHPRLFLRPARLRLLKRERQRTSPRWQQFEALVAGKAQMPETGFAQALYYQITGDSVAGREAVTWALGAGRDLRQQAIVFDWCQDVLSDNEKRDLTARLEKAIAAPPADDSVSTARSRALAAIALFDHVPQTPQRELERMARKWWEGGVIASLKSGHDAIPRDEVYPLFELLHAMRDNANLDLRDSLPRYFKDLPMEHLLTYYPAVFPGADGEYYIGAERQVVEPDLRLAALSRAAELSMVAYDVNAQEIQVLQGWLMHDRFMLRGTFGAPYEFLWANPYQPGLSYYLAPLVYHDPDLGKLVVRSNWEEAARWFGYFDGVMQLFDEGHVTILHPQAVKAPIMMDQAVICVAQTIRKFRIKLEEETSVFLVGLEPKKNYLVEVDDEEMYEAAADPAGIIDVEVPRGREVGIRISPAPTQ
ncbi:MAG TPA: hypothetical protein VKU19_41110 [Bryobacteraceae bacterium]|nr:hypothetical protein [Bryobacteraceae bacterium]